MSETEVFSNHLLEFLKLLKENNDRDWFNTHKDEFKMLESRTKNNFNEVFKALKTHDDVDRFKIFRIYRDVRFSKNKLPYKIHFSGSFNRRKPHLRGSYYLHIQPDNQSFIAVGFWDPSKDDLLRIRKEWEMDDEEIRTIIDNPEFKNIWGGFTGKELKTAPRGFEKDHKAIDLIRKKQFIFSRIFNDQDVIAPGFIKEVNASFKSVRPFLNYMSSILTTDINGEPLI